MKNQALLYALIGLLVGICGTTVIMLATKTTTTQQVASTHSMDSMDHMQMSSDDTSMSMSDMTAGLKGLTGDAFDKKFISEMIVHHQGAVDMANLVATQAKHQEVKDLAKGIISAQTTEISQMRQWQKDWGY